MGGGAFGTPSLYIVEYENIMVRLTTHSLEGREVGVHLETLPHIMHVVPRALIAITQMSILAT